MTTQPSPIQAAARELLQHVLGYEPNESEVMIAVGLLRKHLSHADAIQVPPDEAAVRREFEAAFNEGYDAGYQNGTDDTSAYEFGSGSKSPNTRKRDKEQAWKDSDAQMRASARPNPWRPIAEAPTAPDEAAPKSILIGRGTKLCPQCEQVEAACKCEPRKEGEPCPQPNELRGEEKSTTPNAGSSGAPTFDPEAAPTPPDSASETPLTDAFLRQVWLDPSSYQEVETFARDLERKLAEANRECDDLLDVSSAARELAERNLVDGIEAAAERDDLRRRLAECEKVLLSVACTSVEQLRDRYLQQMRANTERDKPAGFDSWESYHKHVIQTTADLTAARSRVKELENENERLRVQGDSLGALVEALEAELRHLDQAFDRAFAEGRADCYFGIFDDKAAIKQTLRIVRRRVSTGGNAASSVGAEKPL